MERIHSELYVLFSSFIVKQWNALQCICTSRSNVITSHLYQIWKNPSKKFSTHKRLQYRWQQSTSQTFASHCNHFFCFKLSIAYTEFVESKYTSKDVPSHTHMQKNKWHAITWKMNAHGSIWFYEILKNVHKISNISHTLVGNRIVDHSDVVGVARVGTARNTSSFLI